MDQKLVIVPEEAEVVRRIYGGYLESGSLVKLAHKLSREGYTTKRWTSRSGCSHGGRRLTPKYLYRILTNAIYIGKITHKDNVWPGRHEPIIEQELWDRVRAAIEKQDRQTRHRWSHTHLLKGKMRTHEGHRMSPSAVQRSTKDDRKRVVRYYVSQKAIKHGYKSCPIKALNAHHLDELIRALVLDYLHRHDSFDALHRQEGQIRDYWLREMIHAIYLAPNRLTLEIDVARMEACKSCKELRPKDDLEADGSIPTCLYQPDIEQRGKLVILTLAIQIKRLDGKRMLLSPDGHDLFMPVRPEPKPHLVTAIGQAYDWYDTLMESGMSISALAKQLATSESRIHKLLPLTYLAPDILKRVLTGDLPPSLTLNDLLTAACHLDWQAQRHYLSLPASERSA